MALGDPIGKAKSDKLIAYQAARIRAAGKTPGGAAWESWKAGVRKLTYVDKTYTAAQNVRIMATYVPTATAAAKTKTLTKEMFSGEATLTNVSGVAVRKQSGTIMLGTPLDWLKDQFKKGGGAVAKIIPGVTKGPGKILGGPGSAAVGAYLLGSELGDWVAAQIYGSSGGRGDYAMYVNNKLVGLVPKDTREDLLRNPRRKERYRLRFIKTGRSNAQKRWKDFHGVPSL